MRKGKAILLTIISIIVFFTLFLSPISEYLSRNLFFYPLYALFSGLYLPFYIYAISMILVGAVFAFMSLLAFKGDKDYLSKTQKIVLAILAAGYLFIFWNIINDFIVVGKGEYAVVECKLNKLRKYRSRGKVYYEIYSNKSTNGSHIKIKMDVLQYKELLEFKEKFPNRGIVLKTFYMPNTHRLLKYETDNLLHL